jgi:two-component system nitrogen regulation sensor histidine kinase NtrY
MELSFLRNKTLYLGLSLFFLACLLTSLGLFMYDAELSEEELLKKAQSSLQEDLNRCVAKFDSSLPYEPSDKDFCLGCELIYSEAGRLISWTQSEFLPPKDRIDRLSKIEATEDFLESPGRRYIQILKEEGGRKKVILVPVYIQYKVQNSFLVPYVFLGRYTKLFDDEDRKQVKPFDKIPGRNFVRLTSANRNAYLITLKGLPLEKLREPLRKGVIYLFGLGLVGFLFMARVFTLHFLKPSYWSDMVMLALIPTVRMMLWIFDIPGTSYVQLKVFEPSVLAFDDFLAPSLGDMTLNILTFFFVIWLVYKNLFRYLNLVYRKMFSRSHWQYLFAAFSILASCALIRLHFAIFQTIIDNSQVPIEFTNIFQTDPYSYLILLDMGLLLLGFGFLILLLLRFNVLLSKRLKNPLPFYVVNLLLFLVVNALFYLPSWSPFLATTGALGVALTMVFRMPHDRIFRYDLPNYLILLTVGAVLSAYSVLNGVNNRNSFYVKKIADKVLEDRQEKARIGYQLSAMSFVNNPEQQAEIELKYEELDSDIGKLIDWFQLEYLDKNFEVFETRIFAYDKNQKRIDRNLQEKPSIDVRFQEGDLQLQGLGVSIIPDKLYQVPSQNERFIDNYVAKFPLRVDTLDLSLLLQLSSNPYALGSISPIILVNTTTYEEEEFFSSYDYGIYIDRKLNATNGDGAFPVNLSAELIQETGFFNEESSDYIEYIKSVKLEDSPNSNLRTIIVRYPRQQLTEVFTTFSFIFYFYGGIVLLVIVIPIFFSRLAKNRFSLSSLPIRSKIRIALVLVSIMPIVGIILFLYPYINTRFNNQADTEIIEETKRVAKLLREDLLLQSSPLQRETSRERIDELLAYLANTLPYDINVYNEDGRLVGSTEPALYESQIRSGLMNNRAYLHLRYGNYSNMVLDERIGNLAFLAGYQPVVGNRQRPVGYVNVPFLNKKEELNEEVFGLLAYLANIYLLAFLLVGLIAVVVSNAITKPLQLIQQRLATISLGNVNKPINYKSNDEIGAIVSSYNSMVEKLAVSETKLKATQRQLAWRQMARQVAHEIKNPLTPMRLGIQHLNRSWANQSPNLDRLFPKVMKTLMAQIDSLVTIANSFSQFAKMPDPVKKQIKLNDILKGVVNLYSETEGVDFQARIPQEPFEILADKDQLSRALGNIVKNGLQALDDEGGRIRVNMWTEGQNVALIEISDNGRGMTEEVKKRVFEPNFSTKSSGMGLGLAIVRRIIETTGGSIRFESELGVGTTFFITLPQAKSSDIADYERVLKK